MNLDVDNRTIESIVDMAKKFYDNPENVRRFEEWKKTKYGGKKDEKATKKEAV